MGESTGGADVTMATPAARINAVASVRESSGGADTTSGAGTVDGEVEVPHSGNVSRVNLLHTCNCFIHHLYLI